VSAVQLVGQLVVEPLHTYAPQLGVPCVPDASVVQVPTDPETLQASQAPPHALLQQTPSTHWFERQSEASEQVWPLPFLPTHTPPVQVLPAVQSVGTVQVVLHDDAALQRNGAQDGLPAVPAPVGEQVPSLPERLHASQLPLQLVLQQ
jgi:hypothetical protein